MNIPINQKPAIMVTNISLYIASKQQLGNAMGRIRNGEYRVLYNGEYISLDQYRALLEAAEKVLRPVNWKGENRDKALSANIGFINN